MIRKSNNKGLSLVELIIAVAILAIVGVAIMGFVSFSSRNYSLANKNVKLQYEQQMTVNRIRDIVLETSRGIAYDDSIKALTVFSDTAGSSVADESVDPDATPIIVSRISFTEPGEDETAGKLWLQTDYMDGASIKDKKYSEISIGGTKKELTDTVKAFSADLSDVGNGKVTLHITFVVGTKEIEVHPEITLRNVIDIIDDDTEIDELYDKEIIEFTSNVAKVEIVRDGKVFGQGKTDTVALAGDSTTVDYDAIVTKKSYYKGDIITSVTWEIDGLKEGYENNIKLDTATGMITFVNTSNGKTPQDYISDYFILKAISDEDPAKIARLRIKVTTGGVYPKSIDFTVTEKKDLVAAQIVYKFRHSIEYTDKIANDAGNMVNPLTGDDVYKKIKYTVYEEDKTTYAKLPSNAGLTTTGKVDGEFRAVKEMEGKVYMIKVAVLQKDKDGKEVSAWLRLEVGEIPDEPMAFTVPQLYTEDEYRRADFNAASVQWTNGTPTYKTENGGVSQYYVWYEWEIEPVTNEGEATWAVDDRHKFNDNAYLTGTGETGDINPTHIGTWTTRGDVQVDTYTSDYKNRLVNIFVRPRLDWSKTYTMRVSLRARLGKSTGKETYYTLKKDVKIYPYDDVEYNSVATTLNAGTELALNGLGDFRTANGTRVRRNGQYYYVANEDVSLKVSARNGRLATAYRYSDGSGDLLPVWNVQSLEFLNYEPNSAYPIQVRATQTNGGIHTRWVKADQLNTINRVILNKTTNLYTQAIPNGKINAPLYTASGGEEVTVLSGLDSNKIKVSVNGKDITGYTNGNKAGTLDAHEREGEVTKSYYKLPSDENDLDDILTDDPDEAYVSTKLVRIKPVTLTLAPAEPAVTDNNGKALKAYIDQRDTVYVGKGKYYDRLDGYNPYNSNEAYKYIDITKRGNMFDRYYSGYTLHEENYEYYKFFMPTFTGINVNLSNVDAVLGGVSKEITSNGSVVSALQPYALVNGEYTAQSINTGWFDSGYIPRNGANIKANKDYNIYLYVKMEPYRWRKDYSPFPSSVKWTCVVTGKDAGNYVKGVFGEGKDFVQYKAEGKRDPK